MRRAASRPMAPAASYTSDCPMRIASRSTSTKPSIRRAHSRTSRPARCHRSRISSPWPSMRASSNTSARIRLRRRPGSVRGNRRNLQIPDLIGIFPDGAIARELPGARDVANGLGVPCRAIRVAAVELLVRASVVLEIGEVSVEVTAVEQCVADRVEHPRLMLRQEIGRDEIHGLPYFGIPRVVPARVVPPGALGHLLRVEAE